MKVLHIITRMNTGGPAVFLDHLTTSINELGCQSVIVYGFCESNESDYTNDYKLKTELVKIKSLHRSLSPIDDIRAFFQIRKVIKLNNVDFIKVKIKRFDSVKVNIIGREKCTFANNKISKYELHKNIYNW